MGILSWIGLGLVAGLIAKFLLPGKDPGGPIVTILIGIVGAVLGGYLGSLLLGIGAVDAFDLRSVGVAVAGSLVLLIAYRLVTKG